jgi:hypothetical protein
MADIDVRLIQKQRREQANLLRALMTGKDKKGLTFRPVQLTDETRERGGKNSTRKIARVWAPVSVTVVDEDE